MRRRLFILGAVFSARTLAQYDDFGNRAIDHNNAWGKWFRQFIGCPSERTVDAKECDARLGIDNRKLFEKAKKTAKDLWGF